MTSTDANAASYVKHNQRTVRRPCRKCGSTDLYWAHDVTRPGRYCSKCQVSGRWVMVERDGILHRCFANGNASDQTPDSDDMPDLAPAPVQASTNGHGTAQQLADLIGTLAKGALDESAVRAIIADELARFRDTFSVPVPFSLDVRRADGTSKVINGAHKVLPLILAAIQAGENILMVGPMGTGKSTIAHHIAEAFGTHAEHISCNPQTSKTDIVGYKTADGTYVTTSRFREIWEHGGVWLFDELDAASGAVMTLVNHALANGSMAFPDKTVAKHPDTVIIAAANTYGRGPDRMFVGRQQLDAATLDRFTTIEVTVDETLETSLCYATGIDQANADRVVAYVRYLRRSAEDKRMAVGFSPRASVGMCRLMLAGWPVDLAVEGRCRRGLSESDWLKVSAGAPVL